MRSLHRTSRLYLGALAAAFLVSACGGGGGSPAPAPAPAPAPDPNALSIRSATPEAGATDVATDVRPRLLFSHGLDAATATAGSIRLSSGQGTEVFTPRVAGTELTLTPQRRLLPLTSYTLEIGTSLAGTGGERLPAASSFTFTTADASWSAPAALPAPAGGEHKVLVERSGAMTVVWTQDLGATTGVFGMRHTAEGGWSTPQQVNTGAGRVTQLVLSEGRDGEIFLGFAKLEGGVSYSVFSSRFTAATGWEAPHPLENSTLSAHDVRIASDPAGNAIAVWYQWDGVRYSIWAARRPAGAAWGTAGVIETTNMPAAAPELAMNPGGEAIAVWTHYDNTRNSVWAARYTPAGGWSSPRMVDLANVQDRVEPRVAVAPSGEAIAVWGEIDGANRTLRGSHFTPAGGWGATVSLEASGPADSFAARIGMDAAGHAIATWVRDGGASDVWTNRWVPGTGWGTARRMNPAGVLSDAPVLAVNARGEALLVWRESPASGGLHLGAARYRPATGWTASERIASSAYEPHASLNDSGVGMLLWRPSATGSANIQGRRLD